MSMVEILAASKRFLRTREAVYDDPTILGLKRHVQATIELYAVFLPDGSNSRWAALTANIWRSGLEVVSDALLLAKKVRRSMRA